ncbi:putative oxidoreductase, molybdopterin-binding domain, oxidoreductase FAD/NAD(P)-binding protein [Septoria linicola]|nr:putative oxidoreductase, molybdopterin-binding domain, oxidoreductase FAD/NAD(P)-binding protein [Septoria linicola]
MPHDIPWKVSVKHHPGSSAKDVQDEPEWTHGHQHRIGYRNRQDRVPGLTHQDDEAGQEPDLTRSSSNSEQEGEIEFDDVAKADYENLKKKAKRGDLINFRDIVQNEKDIHLRWPENRSIGWRYVLEATEDWIKNEEEWPANIEKKQKEEAAKKEKESHTDDGVQMNKVDQEKPQAEETDQEENDWKRKEGENSKHHDAYAADDESSKPEKVGEDKSEYEKLLKRYTPQEIALLRALQHEKEYRSKLQQNDGKRKSPQTRNRTTIAIDEQDQFSPDNWLPRSDHLIRLTGKHPMNAESDLTTLFEGGLITPNELHYIRNHGAVPRILWEFHELDIENGKLKLSMDDLKDSLEHINIPVALACDGNRRKELNMIKRSKGFSWGSGATGCVYWKGPLLRDVLLAAGVKEGRYTGEGKLRWVNFQGADEPSEGKYETCVPLDYAMDPTNDVILAMEMNDVPLPPDHGYPVRLLIPGYVGGRCVKWLSKIWITDYENDSHYHIWDNRVLPSFITEKDGEFASTMFAHPDTACNEQNLNSVIVKPAQGEKIPLTDARKGKTYRLEGYAYDGGGHEVQRVEISLDGGETWLYCIRKFPDYPIRHGNKFWTWLHWYVDVSMVHLVQAKSISVRAWNVFKNTQPERPVWNTMGMMNNCWYQVKPEITQDKDNEVPYMFFRHPVEPGTGNGGWMKPSTENQIDAAKQEAGAPQKQFTRQEIEKHNTESDCWLVVDNKVYDSTSVLSWHPGGKAAILGHAGKVHQETSDEFASIHDGFAYQKLKECIIGVVTDKAANFIKANAEAAAKEMASSKNKSGDVVLQKHKWVPVKLISRDSISEDTRRYTFGLPDDMKDLGLGTCQHIQLGFHMKDKMLIRSYTPTKPLLPDPKHTKNTAEEKFSSNSPPSSEIQSMQDGHGTFELVIKTYFPTDKQPGGAMSNILDVMPIGEEIEIRGPTGEIVYNGNGSFTIEDEERKFNKISLVLGGSGITPGYALIARALLEKEGDLEVRVVDANKSEKDILLHEELDHFEKESKGRLKVTHVLSHPSDDWKGKKGHVNADILKESLFKPEEGSVVFLCGPPGMIQKAALPALKEWGYKEDENMFGF